MEKIISNVKEKKWYIIATILFFILAIFLNTPFRYEVSNKIKLVHMFIWLLIFLASMFFIIFILDKKANEKTFLKMASILGVFIIVLTPLCNPCDEYSHLFRAVMISQGNFYDQVDENGNIGGYVPENYPKFIKDRVTGIKEILSDTATLTESLSKEKAFFPITYFSSTVPTAHCIPAVGILIARLLRLGIVPIVWTGRLFSYIFYVAFSYLAIKNMKYYKSIMFIVATIPISLWVAGSISIDPILSASCFLFISICLKYYWSDKKLKISKKDICLIFFTGLMILTNKYLAYSPILLLFFIIPKECFANKKQYILMIFFAIILSVLCVLWQFKLLNMFEYTEDRNGNVNQKEQIRYIISNVGSSSRTMINAMQTKSSIYSVKFTHLSTMIFIEKSIGFVIVLGAILEKNKLIEKNKKRRKLSIYTFILFIILLAVSLLALYLSFTPVGDKEIQGYQARYLIPILVLLLIPLANIFNVQNNIKNYERKIVYFMFIANLDIILGVLINSFNI